MSDFRSAGRVVRKDEIFNQSHARLRNVIECAFGVFKARFLILKIIVPYSFVAQTKIVMACFSINNFFKQILIIDSFFFNMLILKPG